MIFENTYKVSEIKNYHDILAYCPLGKDYYSAKLVVIIKEPKTIPDYLDTDSFIDELSGNEYIIEKLAYVIAGHYKEETEAKEINVTAYVENAKHSPVEITVTL